MLNAFNFTKAPRESLPINSTMIHGINQEGQRNIDKSGNVTKTFDIYITILLAIPAIGLIIWWSVYRRKSNSNYIQRQ